MEGAKEDVVSKQDAMGNEAKDAEIALNSNAKKVDGVKTGKRFSLCKGPKAEKK
ncbi:MAG: hypothetical protein WCS90_04545 [Bacilli bacterium]